MKLVEAAFSAPPAGPVKVYVVAIGSGVTELEAADAALAPYVFVAVTVHVYAVPFVSPVTMIGLLDPVIICVPHVAA